MKIRPSSIAWTICFIGLFAAFVAWLAQPQPTPGTAPIATAGNFGGAFTLIDHDGNEVTDKSWPNKYLLLYFGFTQCPDICPLGLNKIAEALNKLPDDITQKIQPLFVTVDPDRDGVPELKIYAELFYPTMIGLTGSHEQIDHIKKLYRVYAEKQDIESTKDYMVNHSSFTYLMGPNGQLQGLYAHEMTAHEMAEEIRKAVGKK